MKRNPLFGTLSKKYLFQEMHDRVRLFAEKNPNHQLISLGVGDTTIPLGKTIAERISQAAIDFQNPQSYVGYGPEQGLKELREKIAFRVYENKFSYKEIFISDGANSDISRVLCLLSNNPTVAVQNPSYPVYAEASVLQKEAKLIYLEEKGGIPDLSQIPEQTVIFLCSPNNPTATCFSHGQYEKLIQQARKKKSLIILDVAYRAFVRSPFPQSIYEIEGAERVAIEIGSFSKMAGFSGIRLGWCTVPFALQYESGQSFNPDFDRIITTLFNGASILSQYGGLHVLSEQGEQEVNEQIHTYMKRTEKLKKSLANTSFDVSGGDHAPYVWVKTGHKNSWEAFDYFLHQAALIVTPGIGFGPGGEGYVRLSGFAHEKHIDEACKRLSIL